MTNFYDLSQKMGYPSVMGMEYMMYGAPTEDSFATSETLHRFYSLYATGNYVYDGRYALSGSWRVDKTDLFGADPKYRGRPLWSVGASWNMHNEAFMKDVTWVDALKLRLSYGLTGNIDSSVSSYLTASFGYNDLYGHQFAEINNPLNDQLRWEKTATWNIGVDFSFFDYRLSGSLDYYYKKGTDILSTTDLDPTTGWSLYAINSGNALNRGVELAFNANIVRPNGRNSLSVNASFNFAYNKNEVTKVTHTPASGMEALNTTSLKKGCPIHSLYSYDFAGLVTEDGMQYYTWRDHAGEIHRTDINAPEFTPDDVVFSGGLDPKVVASFTPEITYAGFTLSTMFNFYGGHYMRMNTEKWLSDGSELGYRELRNVTAVPSSYLDYWRAEDKTGIPGNGVAAMNVVGSGRYMDANVERADYLKLRNIVLSYSLPASVVKHWGFNSLQLSFQMNNVFTWARNSMSLDPEAVNPISGVNQLRTPRSYTFSLSLNL